MTWRKSDPTIPTLANVRKFVWDDEANKALEALKKKLSQAPILAAPRPKEPIFLPTTEKSAQWLW